VEGAFENRKKLGNGHLNFFFGNGSGDVG